MKLTLSTFVKLDRSAIRDDTASGVDIPIHPPPPPTRRRAPVASHQGVLPMGGSATGAPGWRRGRLPHTLSNCV